MIGILHIEDLAKELGRFFRKLPGPSHQRRLLGLVFCQLESPFASQEIQSSLQYFNFRSGNHINFYFAGYEMSTGPDKSWMFSAQEFNEFRKEIESRTSWRYSGGTDLILLNATYDQASQSTAIDFPAGDVYVLEQLTPQAGNWTVGMFFEEIFRYCEDRFDEGQKLGTEEGSAGHFRTTMAKAPPTGLGDLEGLANLQKKLETTCRRLERLAVAVHEIVAQADPLAEKFREAMEPMREMYKDQRMATARAEALKEGIPESIIDRIVAEFFASGFPSVNKLHKSLMQTGELNELTESGHGTARATIGRHLKKFRSILEGKGITQKAVVGRSGPRRATEHYNQDFAKHQMSEEHSGSVYDGLDDPKDELSEQDN